MPDRLAWHHADTGDIADLHQFTCCPKAKKTQPFRTWTHPQHWSERVQNLVRGWTPPCRPGEYRLLGRDRHTNDLVAVVCWSVKSDRTGATIQLVAVSLDRQRQGYGREAIAQAFDSITVEADQRGLDSVLVLCEVHPLNVPSLTLVADLGFTFNSVRNDHQVWALDYLIAGAKPPLIFPADDEEE